MRERRPPLVIETELDLTCQRNCSRFLRLVPFTGCFSGKNQKHWHWNPHNQRLALVLKKIPVNDEVTKGVREPSGEVI